MSGVMGEAEAWCRKAHTLLDEPEEKSELGKKKARELFELVEEIQGILGKSRPEEMTAQEWMQAGQAILNARSQAQVGKKGPGLRDKMDLKKARTYRDETGAITTVEQLTALVSRRREAFASLKLPDLKPPPNDAGQSKLKSLDDPDTAVKTAFNLQTSMRKAQSSINVEKTVPYIPMDNARKVHDAFRAAQGALDLAGMEQALKTFEALAEKVKRERQAVEALQKSMEGQPGAPASDDLASWRKLNAATEAFEALKARHHDVIAKATEMAKTSVRKADQLRSLEEKLEAAVSAWPGLPVDGKLGTDERTEGSIPWIKDRLDRLEAKPGPNPEVEEANRLQLEWDKFEEDVLKHWNAFKDSGFSNMSLRGPFGAAKFRTPHVKSKLVDGASFKIGGRDFMMSHSETTDISLKATIPMPQGGYRRNIDGDEIRSFIYHLVEL